MNDMLVMNVDMEMCNVDREMCNLEGVLDENRGLVSWWNGLRSHVRRYFLAEIGLRAGVSDVTVRRWMSGRQRLKPYVRGIVNDLAGCVVI